MDYKQAWEQLKSQLLARGEYFFFAKGDDPNSVYALGEIGIQTTLEQMKYLEESIQEVPPSDNVIPFKPKNNPSK